jgi:hypothetical protein
LLIAATLVILFWVDLATTEKLEEMFYDYAESTAKTTILELRLDIEGKLIAYFDHCDLTSDYFV